MSAQVRANARITFAPLVETLPCLGAVTISLLDPPHLDVSVSLIGGLDIMILPGIREAAHFALQKACDRVRFPLVTKTCKWGACEQVHVRTWILSINAVSLKRVK